ncbi:MAG TPA: helix-hairpin-helix domain-containing protein [Chitinophagaceae bacterium]|nr:helix-hairpin-helix domain-containing protein [Chitinophagaceae bacterium]
MKWREFVADYLTFSKRDRIAIISILVLVLSIFFLPMAISNSAKVKGTRIDTAWTNAIKKLDEIRDSNSFTIHGGDENNSNNYQYDQSKSAYSQMSDGELFYFDPNTLTTDGWKRLGLREKTINTIKNYLGKGGRFKKPEDLEKIYGLYKNQYEKLLPYVRIKPQEATYEEQPQINNGTTPSKIYSPRYTVIDINTADTTAFIALPGIGSKLAFRIVNFREKLGGFYSIDQIGETYGLPDSTFQKIKQYLKLEHNSLRKININTASVDELKAHPYIKYSIANPIVSYRNEHGPFERIEDIKKVMAITDDIYKKISPYLFAQ